MPYKLRKQPRKNLYWVVNSETSKKHSYEPLPRETAIRQMRALYINEGLDPVEPKTRKVMPSRIRYEKGSDLAKERMAHARKAKKSNVSVE